MSLSKNNTEAESFREFLLKMEQFAAAEKEKSASAYEKAYWSGNLSAWKEASAMIQTYFHEFWNNKGENHEASIA